jgi:hypothetical protein
MAIAWVRIVKIIIFKHAKLSTFIILAIYQELKILIIIIHVPIYIV